MRANPFLYNVPLGADLQDFNCWLDQDLGRQDVWTVVSTIYLVKGVPQED